ncbi:SusC/RagA family TonB-linked outer membrane protein [Saccharicrinis sp. FJH2]|uniref:SusC/RagA family TonB-linked outer membrane protein n=1 Tax=Saccharicrinis sp. FJH65 TaxID=3344659 RepID=UPI0035F4F79D
MKKSLLQPGLYISRKVAVTIAALLITTFGVFAQTQTVKGKVTDAKTGDPLPGVNVVAKGTGTGVITDIDGNYTFNVPEGTETIVYSFIGMKTMEIPFTGQSTINVKLEESSIGLDEVIAIGYGVTTKRDLTGAVASIKTDELVETPVPNVAQALQGKLSGVAVYTQDGRPGADIKIRIRGGGSITQSNDPLVIIDGIPGSLDEIPADQIESIDVLKDASSTAIYGARGANGVILVTTKGLNTPEGKTKISYSGYYQFKEIAAIHDVLNPQEYLLHQWSYMRAMDGTGNVNGAASDALASYYGLGTTYGNHYSEYANQSIHNYTDNLIRNAAAQDHNISISSATEKTKLSFSANKTEDQGIKIKSGYSRHNALLKLEHQLYDKVKIGFDVKYVQSREEGRESTSNGTGSFLSSAYMFKPIDNPLGQADEIPSGFGNGDVNLDNTYNPYTRTMDQDNITYRQRIRGLAYINWDIINGLTLRSEISGNRNNSENQYYDAGVALADSTGLVKDRFARLTLSRGYGYRSATTINYEVQNLGDHKLSVLLGNEIQKSQSSSSRMQMQGYKSDYSFEKAIARIQLGQYKDIDRENYYDVDGNPVRVDLINKNYFDFYNDIGVASTTLSYFGRLNYGYKGRYLLTATLRADGSSKFAPNNRWGYFPAGALAWRISDETFMDNAKGWLDNLKLRISYGTSGADHIPYDAWNYLYYPNFDERGNVTFVDNGYFPNDDLKWETTISRNLGLDLSVFNGRIYGSIELYNNSTKDLLVEVPVAVESGYTSKYMNIGRTSNKGVEIALGVDIIRKKDFTLSLNATYNYNKSNVDELQDRVITDYGTQWNSSATYPAYDYIFKEGTPIGTVQGYVSDGFYTTDDFDYDSSTGQYTLKDGVPYYSDNFTDIGNYPNPFNVVRIDSSSNPVTIGTIFPGALKIKDVNKDGEINTDDITELGQMTPKHTGGFGINLFYKGIDFSANFTYALGGHVYNIASLLNTTGRKDYTFGANRLGFVRDSYKIFDINDSGDLYAVTDPEELDALNAYAKYFTPYMENGLVLSQFIEKSDYLRLNSLTLGYTLPKSLTKKIWIQKLRIYATGGNLLLVTKYTGLDPEVSANESKAAYPTPGLDFGSYPRSRTYTLGVNVDF